MKQLPKNYSWQEVKKVLQDLFDEYTDSWFSLEEFNEEAIVILYDLICTPDQEERNLKFQELEKQMQQQSLKVKMLNEQLKTVIENYEHYKAEIKQKFAASALTDLAADIFLEKNME